MKFAEICRLAVGVSIALGSVIAVPDVAVAKPDAVTVAERRINLAGRQQMLTQRIVSASCFIASDIERSKHIGMLAVAYEQFSLTHESLIKGNRELGLESEIHPNIVVALSKADDLWGGLQPTIVNILNGDIGVDGVDLGGMDKTGLELMGDVDTAAKMITRTYGKNLPDLPLILAMTIDLASRQRVLAQKATKEYCLIQAGIEPDANRANLAKTVNLFNLTLDALIDGYAGVVLGAPNDAIRNKLNEVKEIWESSNKIFQAVATGQQVTDQETRIMIGSVEKALKKLNRVVRAYEQVKDAS